MFWTLAVIIIEDLYLRIIAILVAKFGEFFEEHLLNSGYVGAQYEYITRLTEVAFLFIPLTFAATLLRMQIDQFENRVPLSTFILLGVLSTGLSYGVRLTIRSSWFRTIVERPKESIKIYADRQQQPVQRGYVPTSMFLRWLPQSSWT